MASKLDENRASFLDLCAELRNLIYTECLVDTDPVAITATEHTHKQGRKIIRTETKLSIPSNLVLALLSTCRQIRDEALSLFCGQNRLHFTSALSFTTFTQTFAKYKQSIQKIRIGYMPKHELAKLLTTLRRCKGLELELMELDGSLLLCTTAEKVVKTLGPYVRTLHTQRRGTEKKAAMEVVRFEELTDEGDRKKADEVMKTLGGTLQ